MAPRLAVRLLALAVLAVGTACPAHRVPLGAVPEERGPPTWLFYTDSEGARLVAVHPADPGRKVELEAGPGKVSKATLVAVGRRDGATGLLTGQHAHAVVYFLDDPAGVRTLRVAPAVGREPPTSRQLSRLALPSRGICFIQVLPDHARPDDSLVAVQVAIAGGDCERSERRTLLVRLSMDASAEPLPAVGWGAKDLFAFPLYSDAGAISCLLVEDDTPGAGERDVRIVPVTAPFGPGERVNLGGDAVYLGWDRVWLVSDGGLRFLAGADGLRDPGGVRTLASKDVEPAADGQHLYFTEGHTIGRVRLDGRSAPEVVHTVASEVEVTKLQVSRRRVLFRTKGGDGEEFWSVPKAGGPVARLPPGALVLTFGDSLLLERGRSPVGRGRTLAAVREDGFDPVTLGTDVTTLSYDTYDKGGVVRGDLGFPESTEKELVLVEPRGEGAEQSLALRRVDPVTRRAGEELGVFPPGYKAPGILRLPSGTATLLSATAPGGKDDVFLVDTARNGSLRQLTWTPDVAERVVGPPRPSCSTGGGVSLWALAGLVLGALLRRAPPVPTRDTLLRPGAHCLSEVLQGQREDRRVHLGQDEPLHLAAAGAYEAVEVEPLVPALPERLRSLAAACPDAAHDRDQPETRLVLRPELDSRAGTLSMHAT